MLNLKKPIVFFDLETTGINIVNDRIVEIGLHKINIDGSTITKTRRVNPEVAIPLHVSQIHGIFDEDVINEAPFRSIAKSLLEFIGDADLGGFNCNRFDVPLLVEEFYRSGIQFEMKGRHVVDVQNIFYKMEPRTLTAAYKFYCGKTLENAHSAEADTIATYEAFLGQIERYPELDNSIEALSALSKHDHNADLVGYFIYNDSKDILVNFGKHKGKLLTNIFKQEPQYYDWVMRSEFPFSTKKVMMDAKINWMEKDLNS